MFDYNTHTNDIPFMLDVIIPEQNKMRTALCTLRDLSFFSPSQNAHLSSGLACGGIAGEKGKSHTEAWGRGQILCGFAAQLSDLSFAHRPLYIFLPLRQRRRRDEG